MNMVDKLDLLADFIKKEYADEPLVCAALEDFKKLLRERSDNPFAE